MAAKAAQFTDRALYEAMTSHLWALRRSESDDPSLTDFYDEARRAAFPHASRESVIGKSDAR